MFKKKSKQTNEPKTLRHVELWDAKRLVVILRYSDTHHTPKTFSNNLN